MHIISCTICVLNVFKFYSSHDTFFSKNICYHISMHKYQMTKTFGSSLVGRRGCHSNIFIFVERNIGSPFLKVHVRRRGGGARMSDLTCNFKCLPGERSAGRRTTMPISFSHKIYEKSSYQ